MHLVNQRNFVGEIEMGLACCIQFNKHLTNNLTNMALCQFSCAKKCKAKLQVQKTAHKMLVKLTPGRQNIYSLQNSNL